MICTSSCIVLQELYERGREGGCWAYWGDACLQNSIERFSCLLLIEVSEVIHLGAGSPCLHAALCRKISYRLNTSISEDIARLCKPFSWCYQFLNWVVVCFFSKKFYGSFFVLQNK